MKISIIMPVHNVWHLTRACLDTLFKFTDRPCEVIIVNDCSDDETVDGLGRYGSRIKILNTPTRYSYSQSNNLAVTQATGDIFILLNNDTVLTPNWIEPILSVFESEPQTGIVGNKHLFPGTETLHHCGIAFDRNGFPWHLHPNTDPSLAAVNYQREMPAVTFACVGISRACFDAVGGLDEGYKNGFEDCDFCLRATAIGFKIFYTPASIIYHYGQSSPGRTAYDSDNWDRFSKKWNLTSAGSFERMHDADVAFNNSIELQVSRRSVQKESGTHLAFDISQGNSFAWLGAELAVTLHKQGHLVSLPKVTEISDGVDLDKRAILSSLMRETPYTHCHVKISHYWEAHFRQAIYGDVCIDFYVNNFRFKPHGHLDQWSRHVLLNSQKKIVPSEYCKNTLLDIGVAEDQIKVVPLGYASEIDESFENYQHVISDESQDLNIFVITNSHDLERYGTDLLIQALADAYTATSRVQIHIKDYGVGADRAILEKWISNHPNFPRIVWHNDFLPKKELLELYTKMDVLLCPFRGEGYGMKIIDALALGIPVLMPAFGGPMTYAIDGTFIPLPFTEVAVGECYDSRNYYIGEHAYWCEVDTAAFSKLLKELPHQRHQLQSVGAAARKHVFGAYSWRSSAIAFNEAVQYFSSQQNVAVSKRRAPTTLPLTVLIPTKNRTVQLSKTLTAYQRQVLPRSRFEIVIINDGGDFTELQQSVQQFQMHLDIKIYDNRGVPGPSGARNFGLAYCKGEVVFITGDDIVPSANLLKSHLEAHQEYPFQEVAFIGHSPWHPDMNEDWMLSHIIGEGGQQFTYKDMEHMQLVPFDRFFTSNVSIKRNFLVNLEPIFSPSFKYAAFEDIELAYRLHTRGLELRFLADAVGFHLHPMTIDSFLERQKKVGEMLSITCIVQPGFLPHEHFKFLDMLEYQKSIYRTNQTIPMEPNASGLAVVTSYRSYLNHLEQQISVLQEAQAPSKINIRDKKSALFELLALRRQIFDTLCTMMVRQGMGRGWAQDAKDVSWAEEFMLLYSFRGMMSHYFTLGQTASDHHEYMRVIGDIIPSSSDHQAMNHSINVLKDEVRHIREQTGTTLHHFRQDLGVVQATLQLAVDWINSFSISGRMKNKASQIFSVGRKGH